MASVALCLLASLACCPTALAITPVAGSPFATGSVPFSVAFSPGGGLLATANSGASTVSVFSVGAGGALTPVTGSPFTTGSSPQAVAFSPGGALLATANTGSSTVSVFSVGAGGALTPVTGSPFKTGNGPFSVAFSPGGALLATANASATTVSVFSVGAGGALTPVTGSPFTTGTGPVSMAFSPGGGLLATANLSANSVSVFSVGAGGALTPVTGSPFTTGSFPRSVAFSPGGGLLATANFTVSVFSVGAGGVLTPVAGSPFATGSGAPASVAFSPGGALLATADSGSSTVSVLSVGAGGLLTPVAGSPFATGSEPISVAFSPGGGLLATANADANTVSVFSVPTISSSPVAVPQGVITDGSGAAYGPLTLTAGNLSCTMAAPCTWSVNPALPPGLTLTATAANHGQTAVIAGTPTAVKAAVMTVTLTQSAVAQATFALTISDIENLNLGIGSDPTGMAADPVIQRVFVAATKSNQVDAINASVNPVTATPTVVGGLAGLLDFPVGLGLDAAGATLFASDFGSSSAAQVAPPLTGTGKADGLPGCSQQEGIAQDSAGGDVWVGCYGGGRSGKIAVMTPAGVAVGAPFTLAGGVSAPSGVAQTGTAGHVAVADAAAGKLYSVSTTGVVGTAVLPVGSVPANVAFAAVGAKRFDYVADPGTGQFSVVDESTDTAPVVAANVALPAAANPSQPYGIATDGSSILVVSDANNASAYVYTLTAAAPFATLLYTIALPSSAVPDGVADLTVAGTNLAFIANESGNSVTVIDPPLAAPHAKIPRTPIALGLVGRPIRGGLAGTPRARALAGHALAPELK